MKSQANKASPDLELACGVAWFKLCKLYPKLEPSRMPSIQFNGRLTKTAARIFTEPEYRLVEVSKKLYVGNEQEYYDVLIPHELAHQADYDLNGEPEGHGHGRSWQKIMVALGLPPDRYHNLKI